ncbi:Heme d1 biosynthesis protein NirH [hydrothermal vent metagenome]|uniref:siroheme decarboxylase n=1 Tax=hydrothermal vent metagenome TaxID=652676 RepID=A0A3B1B735_9ZZZZ
MPTDLNLNTLDDLDRRIVVATQAGLPLTTEPYQQVAEEVGTTEGEVMQRMERMLEDGIIRRIGAVPNHYTLGFRGNGMTVWDVPDEKVVEYGEKIGALDFVSHAYHRPRFLPEWRYNLFAMVHGSDRDAVQHKVDVIVEVLGDDNRAHEVLFSTRILKKTGLRLVTSH